MLRCRGGCGAPKTAGGGSVGFRDGDGEGAEDDGPRVVPPNIFSSRSCASRCSERLISRRASSDFVSGAGASREVRCARKPVGVRSPGEVKKMVCVIGCAVDRVVSRVDLDEAWSILERIGAESGM